jgi:hypothetical protein
LIQRKAFKAFDQLKYADEPFTIDELIDKLKGREEKPILLIDYLEEQKNKLTKRLRVDISVAT